MALEFRAHRIPDPNGHDPALRLRGDWIVLSISDGRHVGLGEASHSGADEACIERARELFEPFVTARGNGSARLPPSTPRGGAAIPGLPANDFIAATAISALDQAFHDLIARREGVPVWRLFVESPAREEVPLYATVNRALASRSRADYTRVFELAVGQGISALKCAPFEFVTRGGETDEETTPGLETLESLRAGFPGASIRVDMHARFSPEGFLSALPRLEAIGPAWLEEPCEIGPAYATLRDRITCPLAAGELYFGAEGFREIIDGGWADIVMPDVKHVGGFGRLVDVCRLAASAGIEVSPHNPSGPVSTLASAHAAAVSRAVTSLEIALDTSAGRDGARIDLANFARGGVMRIPDTPGWGLEPEEILRRGLTIR